jgi:hypothetical protein
VRAKVSYGSEFDEFWAAYPRRVGKGAAAKSWQMVTASVSPEVIMAGLRRHEGYWPSELQYIPHPATWLNQGRWQDDPRGRDAAAAGPRRVHDLAGECIQAWSDGRRAASLCRVMLANDPLGLARFNEAAGAP